MKNQIFISALLLALVPSVSFAKIISCKLEQRALVIKISLVEVEGSERTYNYMASRSRVGSEDKVVQGQATLSRHATSDFYADGNKFGLRISALSAGPQPGEVIISGDEPQPVTCEVLED